MILWYIDAYEYAYTIFFLSLGAILESLYGTVTNINKIRKMAKYQCEILVKRRSDDKLKWSEISSQDLVPGDVVVVPENCLMPCDMVLLTGSAIVNESMLTGEAMPVLKHALNPSS